MRTAASIIAASLSQYLDDGYTGWLVREKIRNFHSMTFQLGVVGMINALRFNLVSYWSTSSSGLSWAPERHSPRNLQCEYDSQHNFSRGINTSPSAPSVDSTLVFVSGGFYGQREAVGNGQ
jgi:hypothetical protein